MGTVINLFWTLMDYRTETKAGDKRSKVHHDHWENLTLTGYSERKRVCVNRWQDS